MQMSNYIDSLFSSVNPFAEFSFIIFHNGGSTPEKAKETHIIKLINNSYPNSLMVIFKYYFLKELDEIDIDIINKEILDVYKNELKEKTTS